MRGGQVACKLCDAPLSSTTAHGVLACHRLRAPLVTLRNFSGAPATDTTSTGSYLQCRPCAERFVLCAASQAAQSQSAAQRPLAETFDITGVWVKDMDASDTESYNRALDIMKLGRLQKITAARLIEGLDVRQSAYSLTVQFLTVVPFFKVTERFSFNRETTMQRRDLRGGEQRARLLATPDGLLASIRWGDPHAGGVEEAFTCPEQGVLHVTSTVTVGAQSETTLQVYRRSDSWKPKNKFTLGTFGLTAPPKNIWEGH